jgi:DNA-binding response OmpR family regulator
MQNKYVYTVACIDLFGINLGFKMQKAARITTDIYSKKKLEKIQVLILDNSPNVTTLFKDMLMALGFSNIFTAHSGFQGVHILKEVRINLIITDWDLQLGENTGNSTNNVISHQDILSLSGADFVRRLRHAPSSPDPFIPVIMFADTVERMDVITARDAGVDEICIKPLSAEDLCQRIMAVIDRPRIFITAETYKGPCRRQREGQLPNNLERRKKEVRVIKFNEAAETKK